MCKIPHRTEEIMLIQMSDGWRPKNRRKPVLCLVFPSGPGSWLSGQDASCRCIFPPSFAYKLITLLLGGSFTSQLGLYHNTNHF